MASPPSVAVRKGPAPGDVRESDFFSLGDGWSELLARYNWQWFCTFTFRDAVHPERADKAFRYWIGLLNRDLYGRHWYRNRGGGVFYVRALEYQKRDVLHYHALIGDVEDLNHRAYRVYWAKVWEEIAGFAKIEVPRLQVDVGAYVSKYVTKGGEIDLSANLGSYAEQISAVRGSS